MMSPELHSELVRLQTDLHQTLLRFPIDEHRDFYAAVSEWADTNLELLAEGGPQTQQP